MRRTECANEFKIYITTLNPNYTVPVVTCVREVEEPSAIHEETCEVLKSWKIEECNNYMS